MMALTKKQRLKVFNKSGGKCWYCGCNLPEKGWHADHVEAIYRDVNRSIKPSNTFGDIPKKIINYGMWKPENDTINNMVPACAPCNLFKATYSVEGLRNQLSMQVERGLKSSVNFRMAVKFGLIEITNKPVKFWFETNQDESA